MSFSAETYALSKKYTNETAAEFGALKGASCQVQSIEKANNRNTVTFLWENSNGDTRTSQMVVEDGTPIYEWHSGDSYDYGDICIYASTLYRCISPNSDVSFDDTKWNELGSPDGNYDIVATKNLLPPIFTPADRKMYYCIGDGFFYLWDGYDWIPQIDETPREGSTKMITSGGVYSALEDLETQINQDIVPVISALNTEISTETGTRVSEISRLESLINAITEVSSEKADQDWDDVFGTSSNPVSPIQTPPVTNPETVVYENE